MCNLRRLVAILFLYSSVTAKEAKEALQEYVSQQCCYGSGAAREMDIKDIKLSSAFHVSYLLIN